MALVHLNEEEESCEIDNEEDSLVKDGNDKAIVAHQKDGKKCKG